MGNLIDGITDNSKRQQAVELAKEKGWDPDLAALAVLSGRDVAVEIIEDGLKAAASSGMDLEQEKHKEEICNLVDALQAAKQAGNTKESIRLKSHLYHQYGIGSL